MTVPTTTLVITTYNNKEFLKLSLETVFEQTYLPDEIIIADDGSREDTAEMIRGMTPQSPVPLIHVWQPDQGFRAARSRNNAVAIASGEYLIFLDGDCYLNKYFIEDHLLFAQKNQFVVGTRVNIGTKRREHIFRTGNHNISFFSWGITKKLHAIRSHFLSRFRQKGGMASANFAAWRSDMERVNGFNEFFEGLGWEDGELATRLVNAGVTLRKMVHLGMVYHFSHPQSAQFNAEGLKSVHYSQSIDKEKICCFKGLNRAREEGVQILNK
ncbi:MAG: glycosyltransferase family 2 protein [Planctomycetaceae bacterium]|jgi:GT2 family glycosyltransferase|nr:glycosyltransferase family 2 protein [Planctomycetaceae bacterium]